MKTLLRGVGLAMLGALALTGAARAYTSKPGSYYAMPSWDQQLPASSRWIVLTNWGSAAVLDRETGLVWQLNPFLNIPPVDTWNNAFLDCQEAANGGRFGWRLPSVEELLTLMDPTTTNLFFGAPFPSVQGAKFWTATTDAATPTDADAVTFQSGSGGVSQPSKGATLRMWCVRGYQGTQSPQ
jgi:uncharacterized protein DUF1566